MTPTSQVTLVDGVRVVVPDSLDLITPYVLREQLDWFEEEIKFVRGVVGAGEAVIDIGASYGVYSLSLAKVVGSAGRVWAFEPNSNVARMLTASVAANGFTQIQVEQRALTSSAGTAKFCIADQPELSSLKFDFSRTRETEQVRTSRLDDCMEEFGWKDIAFVKLDAHGVETEILDGGRRFLTEQSPLIQYELMKDRKPRTELTAAFAALRYESFRLVPGLSVLAPYDPDQLPDDLPLNLLCCKPDRAARLEARGMLVRPTAARAPSAFERLKATWRSLKTPPVMPRIVALSQHPYARPLQQQWENFVATHVSDDLVNALAQYAASQDRNLPMTERLRALESSVVLLQLLCETDPANLRRASFARVAAEYGLRWTAARTLAALAQDLIRSDQVALGEPFLAPGARFDEIDPGTTMPKWILASVLDECERLSSYSSFYTGLNSEARLEAIRDLGYSSEEMRRRLDMVKERFGRTPRR
jgi:FkbM family methyltransferase